MKNIGNMEKNGRLEDSLPRRVANVVRVLDGLDVQYRLSRNEPSYSCADAASKRVRGSAIGIDLRDELKTVVFRKSTDTRPENLIFAHCRGAKRISQAKLCALSKAGAKLRLVSPEDLSTLVGMEFGTVNPFEVYGNRRVSQWFDNELVDGAETSLVMTNAGDLKWAVDFDIREFAQKYFPESIGDIIQSG